MQKFQTLITNVKESVNNLLTEKFDIVIIPETATSQAIVFVKLDNKQTLTEQNITTEKFIKTMPNKWFNKSRNRAGLDRYFWQLNKNINVELGNRKEVKGVYFK